MTSETFKTPSSQWSQHEIAKKDSFVGAGEWMETAHIWQSHVKSDLEESAQAEKSKPCSDHMVQ